MASIKQLDNRRFKITVSNGYRPDRKKICKAKTIRVPESIPKRGIRQYVAHEAEELERQFKAGYCEDGNLPFQEYAERWLARQVLPPDAGEGVSLHRGHPHQPPAAHRTGEYAGRTAEADISGQTHWGGHGAEVPDRGLRRPH